jgi:hypothetical protein
MIFPPFIIHGVSVGIPASSVEILGRVVAFTCTWLVRVEKACGEGDSPVPLCCVGVGVELTCLV